MGFAAARVLPQGPYLGIFQARKEDGTLLFCVDINFRVTLGLGLGRRAGPAKQPTGQGDVALAEGADLSIA
jgi:hypothetical protein